MTLRERRGKRQSGLFPRSLRGGFILSDSGRIRPENPKAGKQAVQKTRLPLPKGKGGGADHEAAQGHICTAFRCRDLSLKKTVHPVQNPFEAQGHGRLRLSTKKKVRSELARGGGKRGDRKHERARATFPENTQLRGRDASGMGSTHDNRVSAEGGARRRNGPFPATEEKNWGPSPRSGLPG